MEGYASGRFSSQADVKRFFEAQPEFPKDLPNGQIRQQKVGNILSRVIYAGYIEHEPWGITRRKGHHEALISLETYEAIQNRRNGKGIAAKRPDISKDFPLRGAVNCAFCDKPMTAYWARSATSRRYPYYNCQTRDCSHYRKAIRAEKIDAGFLEKLKGFFEDETGRTLSPSQSEMYLLETAAYMFAIRAGEDQLGFENCFVAWAQEKFLEARGIGRNTERLQPSPATTTLRFATEAPALTRIRIPAGTRVSDAAGQAQFLTQSVAYIEVGGSEVDVAAEATQPGSFANGFPAASLTSIVDPVPGIATVTSLTETGNGADIEALSRYRARVALAFERIGDGLSKERYLTDVLGWNARCIDVTIERPQPGYVNLHPLMDTGAPNAEELASLLSVFDESNIHQGDFIQAFAPSAEEFAVPLALILSNPDAKEPARAAVQAVLDTWTQSLGGYIAPSELIRVAKEQAGVVEADIPGLGLSLVPATKWRKGTIANVTVEVV